MIPGNFDLPDFDDPPVGEVVLSVQFAKINGFEAAHFGRFWEILGPEFSKTETHPPLPPVVERFDAPAAAPKISVQFREVPPIPRVWFLTARGDHLIQIQPDRFSCNWRKMRSGDKYPRYEQVRGQFDSAWKTLVDFLREQGLSNAPPEITQCEVGYINHIAQSGVWSNYREGSKVLRHLSGDSPEMAGCLTQEAISFATSYVIRASDSEGDAPMGRLHLEFGPGVHTETKAPIYILNLLARGMLLEKNSNGMAFLDLGRQVIVDSFKRLSTTQMHKVWGLK